VATRSPAEQAPPPSAEIIPSATEESAYGKNWPDLMISAKFRISMGKPAAHNVNLSDHYS
jgi:hypothetical protein